METQVPSVQMQAVPRPPPSQRELQTALRSSRVLNGLLPALEALASAPNRRGLLQSQQNIQQILPQLRRVHETSQRSLPPPLKQSGYRDTKHFSPAGFQLLPLRHQVEFYAEEARQKKKELNELKALRELQKTFPGVPVAELQRRHLGQRPFKPPLITNPAALQAATAPLILVRGEKELLQNTPLRAQSHFALDLLEPISIELPAKDALRLLAPALGVLRDNSAHLVQLAETAARADWSMAGRELATRILQWFSDPNDNNSWPQKLCMCGLDDPINQFHQQIAARIDLLPIVDGLLADLDVSRLRTLEASQKVPRQWDSCIDCEIAVVLSTSSTSQQPANSDPRCCSLQRRDFGQEKCSACEHAGYFICRVPCKDCREIMEITLESVKSTTGDRRTAITAAFITSMLPLNCQCCHFRKVNRDYFKSLVNDDDSDDDFVPDSEESVDSEEETQEREEIMSPLAGKPVSGSRAASKSKPKLKELAKVPDAPPSNIPDDTSKKETTEELTAKTMAPAQNAVVQPSGDTDAGQDLQSTGNRACTKCRVEKPLSDFDRGRQAKAGEVNATCRSCLINKWVSTVYRQMKATAFTSTVDVDKFMQHVTLQRLSKTAPHTSTRICNAIQMRIDLLKEPAANKEKTLLLDLLQKVQTLFGN